MKYCPRFYEYLYVDNNEGGIGICPWISREERFVGNILTEDVVTAYNSEAAAHIRATMDDQSFAYCRPEACPYLQRNDLEEITPEEYENRKKKQYYPTEINLAYDFVCNQSCETCRKTVFVPPDNYAYQMETIREKLTPVLDSARIMSASGHGDPFASKYMMRVLENLRPTNPKLHILLETNGVFFDEEHWERIKHLAAYRLEIIITTNSFNEFTYKHISRGGNYEKLMKNLEFVSQLRRDNYVKVLNNSIVVQDRNFRELPDFIKRSFEDYTFDCIVVKPVYKWAPMDDDVYWFKDVLNPLHPYHNEYLEIMKNPILRDSRVYNMGGDAVHAARPYPCGHEDKTGGVYG